MLISELLNSKIEVNVERAGFRIFLANATIDNIYIEYEAIRGEGHKEYEWDVSFSTIQLDENGKKKGPGKYGITGTGHELQVLSFAKEATLIFVKKCDPKIIVFTAEKEQNKTARGNVYEKMVKRWNIPGYEYQRSDDRRKAHFTLEREFNDND